MATPLRNLRVPDDEWAAWKQAAGSQGVTAWIRSLAAAALRPVDSKLSHTPTPTLRPTPTTVTRGKARPNECAHPRGARVQVNPDLGLSRCGACGDTIRR